MFSEREIYIERLQDTSNMYTEHFVIKNFKKNFALNYNLFLQRESDMSETCF